MSVEGRDILSLWTIYDRPLDYPQGYVARRWEIRRGAEEPVPTTDSFTGDTLSEVRALIPQGLYCLPRQTFDDPKIVETWV